MTNISSSLRECSPQEAAEWERYYDLRWRVLREPWNQPAGSERDELERESFHAALWDGDRPVAIGRLHLNSSTEAQVRYMAVDPARRGQGLGSRVLGLLEAQARQMGAQNIILNAREEAAVFYRLHGYETLGSGSLLFGVIPHLRMGKSI